MRDKINVIYYPDMFASHTTLKKAILFFDEIHFMDRPSFTFGSSGGTIGAPSPLRQFEASFRDNGVPLFVHGAPGGPVEGDFYEQITADVNDLLFLTRFQDGLRDSETFRDLQIAHGDYNIGDRECGTHEDVAQRLVSVDLPSALSTHETAMAVLADPKIHLFRLLTPTGCAKNLVFEAAVCSAKMNFALSISSKHGFIPLADAAPYGSLLGAKYARAIQKLESGKNHIQITDLSFAVFDELIPTERLEQMTFEEVIRYRKASETAREEFLTHLAVIQAKQASIGSDGDYASVIDKIVKAEILPAVRNFRNKLQTIHESFYGALAKGALGYVGSATAGVNFFGDLSWEKLLGLASLAGVYIGKAYIDGIVAAKAAKRECAISYILSLDKHGKK
jgi:hypothetical protein